MFYFPMRPIAAGAITIDIPCAVTIIMRNIRAIGKRALNAEKVLTRKCMFGTERMNIILKSWKIPQVTNRPNARYAARSLLSEKMDTQWLVVSTFAGAVPRCEEKSQHGID